MQAAFSSQPFPLNHVVPWSMRREALKRYSNLKSDEVHHQVLSVLPGVIHSPLQRCCLQPCSYVISVSCGAYCSTKLQFVAWLLPLPPSIMQPWEFLSSVVNLLGGSQPSHA